MPQRYDRLPRAPHAGRRCPSLASWLSRLLLICVTATLIAQDPPRNPHLVPSVCPTAHMNSYRQGFASVTGPTSFRIDGVVDMPGLFGNGSPWILASAVSPEGRYALYTNSGTHLCKFVVEVEGGLPKLAQAMPKLTGGFNFGIVLLAGNRLLARDGDRLYWLKDDDPASADTRMNRSLAFDPRARYGKGLGKYAVLYDGRIAVLLSDNTLHVFDQDFRSLDALQVTHWWDNLTHNDLAIDESNTIYMVGIDSMAAVRWSGTALEKSWQADYDFGKLGSGTTPTLMDTTGGDRLVLVCDAQEQPHLVAFWRDQIPAGHTAIPRPDGNGLYDRRVASVIELVDAQANTTVAPIENSPVCHGNGIAMAQYNGWTIQSGTLRTGVWKFVWSDTERRLNLVWHNDQINLNGILNYSPGSGLIYGSGRKNGRTYYYYGLDWESGALVQSLKLGQRLYFDDPGATNLVLPDGRIVYGSVNSLVVIGAGQDG